MANGQLFPDGYLSTNGNQIVDQNGNDVRIASIGWNQNFSDIPNSVAQIAAAGFNCIRLSWVDATLDSDLPRIEAVVNAAAANGIKVILDHHTNEAGTPADGYGSQQVNGLWYDVGPGSDGTNGVGVGGTVDQARFQADWVKVASAFAGNATVIGFDLDNEPLTYGNSPSHGVNWGGGGPNDIQAMYQNVGNAVEAADPGALIIAEGPIGDGENGNADGFDLTKVATNPVVLNTPDKVVYSVHAYPSAIGAEAVDSGPAAVAQMNTDWGYIESQNIAPIWVGEIGASLDGTADSAGSNGNEEQAWADTMVAYLNGQDGALGGPTFTGGQQGISTDWWAWGYNPGQWPDGVLNADGSLKSGQQAVWSHFLYQGGQSAGSNATPNAASGTPASPALASPTSASANDTVITAGSAASITDAGGNIWSINAAGQVTVNGAADTMTRNVLELAYVKGTIWQQNTAGLWWSKATPNAAWGPVAGSPASPLSAASANDTVLLAGTQGSITDAAANTWTITGNGQVAVNGVTDASTAHVSVLAYVNGVIWQENTSNLWWSKTSPADAWGPTRGSPDSPLTATPVPAPTPSIAVTLGGVSQVISIPGAAVTALDGNQFALDSSGVIQAALGVAATEVNFLTTAPVNVLGGPGTASITSSAAAGAFVAGPGALTVTGGNGADAYAFGAGSGQLTITDFSVAKGDTLTISQGLQSSMQTASDHMGGTLISFAGGGTIDIRNMPNVPAADITWN